MSNEVEKQIWSLLEEVTFPGMSRNIVSFGFVDEVGFADGVARVVLAITTHNPSLAEEVRRQVELKLVEQPQVSAAQVELMSGAPASPAQQAVSQQSELIPHVQHVIAVASGKGGVGKSTVAANLSVKLAQMGYRVGLLDADIYGPSQPMMFGIEGDPVVEDQKLVPFERFGVRVMSLGFILDVDTPVIWRGPMVIKAIEQLLGDVAWGPLDYMIVDLPPGTGDAQLTISQKVPLSGAVIVSTPQDIALIDARKGLAMFEKVSVPVIGIVENMSSFVCPHCGESTDIFKRGGGEETATELEARFLGRVPLDPAIVAGGDAGEPIVVSQQEGPHAEAFARVAEAVVAEVAGKEKRKLSIF
jgi:ATP-binding protein involved in chromosome partitioning